MIKILTGKAGSGKTKELIQMANKEVEEIKGNIVYLDADKDHMYDLKHEIRFLNMNEFPINKADEFVGFLCGIISNNYDIQTIYVDGLYKMVEMKEEEAVASLAKLEVIADKFNIKFNIGMKDLGENAPEGIKKYIK